MCGIFGLALNNNQHQFNIPEIISCVKEKLHHRGPDFFGSSIATNDFITDKIQQVEASSIKILFCHARLSIIDLSDRANQPLISDDYRYQIIFNGEIYNYKTLRKSLEKNGIVFTTTSDTEVLFKGLIHEGKQFILKLEGMFSFAFFDNKTQQILLARDHFGIKPLYYHQGNFGFSFCSELPALINSLRLSPSSNPPQLFDYFNFFGTSDYNNQTFFQDIFQLLPGHYLEYDLNTHCFETTSYWSPQLQSPTSISEDDAASEIKLLFTRSVKKHLESDVAIAVALSGGIDSSAIACVINTLHPDRQIDTFSYLSDDPKQSEKQYIDIINKKINSQHHFVTITSDQFVSDLSKFVYQQAQPFRSSSMYSQYCVFQAIHDCHFKVVIDGQGADELLGGYSYFIGDRATSLLFQGNISALFKLINASKKDEKALQTILKIIANMTPDCLYPLMTKVYGNPLIPDWMNKTWLNDKRLKHLTINRRFQSIENNILKGSIINSLLSNGIKKLLRYQDHSSMAHSVESRVPFLDVPLAEFILSLPEHLLINNEATTKHIFRNAMRDTVPFEILNRRDKIGFNTPEIKWLTKEKDFVYDVLNESKHFPLFNTQRLISDWDDVVSGKKRFHSRIWLWINTILWAREFNVDLN